MQTKLNLSLFFYLVTPLPSVPISCIAPVITPKGQRKPRPVAPELPPLFTPQSTIYEQAVCPRFVGNEIAVVSFLFHSVMKPLLFLFYSIHPDLSAFDFVIATRLHILSPIHK